MSGRDGRDWDSKRHRSRFDREPSPKRSRRDGKPVSERVPSNNDLNIRDHTGRDSKHHRRLQDAAPLEAKSAPDAKVETGAVSRESNRKHNGHHERSKHPADPTEIPRSRSYFQHDERGSARQVGRKFGRRGANERGWWKDAEDQHDERVADKPGTNSTHPREEKTRVKGDERSFWAHDRFHEMEADPPPPARKRPAFREKKIPVESENADKATGEPEKEIHPDCTVPGSERREDRSRNPRHLDRPERPSAGDRLPNRGESWRQDLPSRERYGGGGGGGTYRGRDRSNGRQRYNASSTRDEKKWEHDMFDEANKSPLRKNEEDQIAKVEALLAS